MVQADNDDSGGRAEQFLEPGEKVMRYSSTVGIKKFHFNAYITDRRIFLIDQNEKKMGVISKEIPRDVVMGSHLESPGSPDPFLVLTIRTSVDETRTLKIAFIQEGDDRTAEIEEWISLLHGRPIRPSKSIMRHREPTVTVQKDDLHHAKSNEKTDQEQPASEEAVVSVVRHRHDQSKARHREADTSPGARPVIMENGSPAGKQSTGPVPRGTEISFCHHCGKKAPGGANFCPFCGTKLHRPDHST